MYRRAKTTAEAAEYLGCSAAALRCWRKNGIGPRFFRAGRLVRYQEVDLDRWVESRSIPAKVESPSAGR
jgi:excisionase family DNA binding protein